MKPNPTAHITTNLSHPIAPHSNFEDDKADEFESYLSYEVWDLFNRAGRYSHKLEEIHSG